ncbi:alpha-L-fucosidase [Aquisalinus flavus]|uniref:alpha-L-fucosidase n=1 Tax=Aquisalinus flavus TaxID=1526572 RepID=A0A8J2V2L4_9PROT|nr:alpha-L-fucosidase [Aquisalinus flavus]MBD0425999.1 alpha-L-fucosidase [Aquisalinus flavus]UNE48409.1 alpha-L-fucosidase [Aquisalinus flavus]GGD11528.1 hypothetical protein GCM10011342_20410 [Aquisalinus flavus]
MKLKNVISVLVLSLLPTTVVLAQAPEDGDVSIVQNDSDGPSVEWFRDAKFGMFVHWGVSSQTGGQWRGENYYGITEWLWRRSEASREDYLGLLDTFDPQGFDADEWVSLAKEAGAKYIVVTAKHHDGVAMFDTDFSDYDVTDGAPFGRDPMKELSIAAEKEGIRLGFYYSQFQDWEHPDGGGNEWEYDPAGKDFSVYQQEKAIPQLDELLTNYGDVALIWFDTPGDSTLESARQFVDFVRERQPDTLISSRIGHGLGDYQNYRDSEIPVVHESSRPFEAIFPHNESWGYTALDTNFKSTTELLHILADVASKGGNFLLNVGPDGNGKIPEASVNRFREIGKWMDVNGESIYGTSASPFAPVPWGTVTQRDGAVYLHVLEAPASREIFLPSGDLNIRQAKLLATGKRLSVTTVEGGLKIGLPDDMPDSRNSVVALYHNDGLLDTASIEERRIITVSSEYEATELEPEMATFGGNVELEDRRYWHNFGEWKHFPSVKGIREPDDTLSWQLRVLDPGQYTVTVRYSADASEAGQEGVVEVAGQSRIFRVLETGEFEFDRPVATFSHHIGTIEFTEPGDYSIVLRPAQVGTELMKFRQIEILPHD